MKKLAILLVFLFSLVVFAANEIQIAYEEGSTLYARVREADGDVWNTSGTPAFENWADGNVTDYDIALTDEEGAHYQGAFPSCSTGIYTVSVYLRGGANPAVADLLVGTTDFVWEGSAEITDYVLWQDTNEMQVKLPSSDYLSGSPDSDGGFGAQDKTDIENQCIQALTDTGLAALFDLGSREVNDASATTTSFVTNLPSSTNDFYKGMIIMFKDGALDHQSRYITGYVGSTKTVTCDAFTSAPADDDPFWVCTISYPFDIESILADSNDIQEDWATVVADVNTIKTDSNDIQEDWSGVVSDTNDTNTKIVDLWSTSGAGGYPP